MDFKQKFYNLLKTSPRCVNEGVFISSLDKEELDYFFSALSETAKKNIIKGEYAPSFELTRVDIMHYLDLYFSELKLEEADVSFVNYLLKRNLLAKSILITYLDKFDLTLLGNIITNSRELRCDKELQLLIMANNYGNDAYLNFLEDHKPKNAKLWKMRDYSINGIMKHRELFSVERVLSHYFKQDNLILYDIEQLIALVANIKIAGNAIEITKIDNPYPYKNVYGQILKLLLKLMKYESERNNYNSKFIINSYVMIYVQISEINNELENLTKVPNMRYHKEYLLFAHMIPKNDYEILKEFKPDLTLVSPNVRAVKVNYKLYFDPNFDYALEEASMIVGSKLQYYNEIEVYNNNNNNKIGDFVSRRNYYIINPNDRFYESNKSANPDYIIEEPDAEKIGNLFKGAFNYGEYLNIGSDFLNKSFCDSYGIPEQVLVMRN